MTAAPRLSEADLERRRLTVAEYFLVWEDNDDDSPSLREQLIDRRRELRLAYLEVLPTVAVSRCPFTHEVLRRAVDVVDINGLYWEAKAPTRPPAEEAPANFIGMSGAMRIGEPVALAPFLAKPGPEVPFVRPDILRHEAVTAVITELPVGPHVGYPICSFLDPRAGAAIPTELRLNEWGSERFRVHEPGAGWKWGSELDDDSSYDYDVAAWVEAGKLQWIAPGDADLTLRTGADDCPYLDLRGHRAVTRIEDGDVWWPEDVLGRPSDG